MGAIVVLFGGVHLRDDPDVPNFSSVSPRDTSAGSLHNERKRAQRRRAHVGQADLVISRRAAAALAFIAFPLLAIAEFSTVFEVTVGPLEVVRRSATAGKNHGYALLVIAAVAAAMTVLALRGARPPAAALVALGATVLAIALAVDLPDTRGSRELPESLAYEDARARAGAALGLEIAGGLLLVAAGGLLLASGRRERPRRG